MNIPEILASHAKWIAAGCRGPGRANLRGVDLRGVDLTGTDLRGADLTGANLTGADLTGANLTGVDLRRAILTGADLTGVDLGDLVIPIIPQIDAAILAAIGMGGCLDMSWWHTCDTTHCRAGWTVTLAGDAGAALEKQIGTNAAAAFIYARSRPGQPVPDWYASDEDALADMCAWAARDAAAQTERGNQP